MIYCTAYMEVPLWKNLDFPRSPNPPFLVANLTPIKRKPPLTSFATAHRSWGDVGKVMKGIIGAPD
jgi:hypothetical protein